jgi:hypothetical protein
MNKPTVGQKLWLNAVGNNARYGAKISEGIVTKVGNKYFSVSIGMGKDIDFHLDIWRQKTEYSEYWKPYESEQDIHDERKRDVLYCEIRSKFQNYNTNLTLQELEQIAEILNVKPQQ